MKNFTLPILAFLLFFSCGKSDSLEEEQGPDVSTGSIFDIQATRATSGGSTIAFGVGSSGVCWSTSPNPTLADNHTDEGPGTSGGSESWTSVLTDLTPSTEYHVRAYATNADGTGYGRDVTFTTNEEVIIPCSPEQNSLVFNNQVQTFSSITAGAQDAIYGTYGVEGNGPLSDITIDFYGPPETAVYRVLDPSDSFENFSYSCKIGGTFGGIAFWQSRSGGDVYVEKLGEDKYDISFCGVEFGAAGFSFTVEDCIGNLVVE